MLRSLELSQYVSSFDSLSLSHTLTRTNTVSICNVYIFLWLQQFFYWWDEMRLFTLKNDHFTFLIVEQALD